MATGYDPAHRRCYAQVRDRTDKGHGKITVRFSVTITDPRQDPQWLVTNLAIAPHRQRRAGAGSPFR
ncbi:hypothetical protein GCM10027579_00800 [Calidifontibacter terrae]